MIKQFFADSQKRVATPTSAFIGSAQVQESRIKILKEPNSHAMQTSQLLHGECFDYFELTQRDVDSSWYLIQSHRDHYVGYIQRELVEPSRFIANAKVTKLSTALYVSPDMKSPIIRELPLGAEVKVTSAGKQQIVSDTGGHEYVYSESLQGWLHMEHIQYNNSPHNDPVALARQFIGQSYLWGGRSGWGCDCSSLVQLCYELCGCVLPRDTHLQEQFTPAYEDISIARQGIKAGDLLFWSGHVAMAASNTHLIHATQVGMQVIEEPIEKVCQRILLSQNEQVRAILRPKIGC